MKFAKTLAAELRSPTLGMSPRHGHVIQGQLDTGVVLAEVMILVPSLFKDLKRTPPKVFCEESWIRRGPEWHNGPPLCWVLSDEWRDVMNWRGKPVAAILNEGRQWFLDAVRCLLNRHYHAELEGMTTWPTEWPFWGHFAEGARQYRRAKKSTRRTK